MALALPSDLAPAHATLLREILARLEGGVRFGPSWRARERRYPTPDSPVCLVIEVVAGSTWRTVAVIGPAGIDAATLGGLAASDFALAGHTHDGSGTATYTSATRPAASAAAPPIIRVQDPGQPGQFQGCVQQSGGTYEWIIIGIASQ